MNLIFLGDSGYTHIQLMLTPVHYAITGTPASIYSREITGTRYVIETTFGRFGGILRIIKRETPMQYDPVSAAKIIVSAGVLHNFILANG